MGKNRKYKQAIALGMAVCLGTVTGIRYSHTLVYAENTNTQNTISASFTEDGDTVHIALSGNLASGSWWYAKETMNLTYSDGTTKNLLCILNAGQSQGSLSLDWKDIGATAEVTDTDQETGAFIANYTVSKTAMGNPVSVTYGSQSYTFNQGEGEVVEPTDPEQPEETETPDNTENTENGDSGESQQSLTPNTSGKITLDGSIKDWVNVPSQDSNDSIVSSWKIARDTSGNLYICFEGTSTTEWDRKYEWEQITINQGTSSYWNQVNNIADKAYVNEAHGNTAGPFSGEFMIPASVFTGGDFTVTFAGKTISSSDISILDGTDVTPSAPSTYEGIVIDGKFDDWNAVKKEDAKCPNSQHPYCLESTAMVFDGDYVYIYIKDGSAGDASGAGTHSNGKWAITTDLGRQLLFTLNPDGTVSTPAEGVECIHVGSQWEISVPASQLPNYKNSINWGLYGVDEDSYAPFVTGVTNLNGSSGTAGDKAEIEIDGQYGDWDNYPSGYYEYTTNGNQTEIIDSQTSITSVGKTLYQYVTTKFPEHLNEAGGEMTQAITIRLNQNDNYRFYPRVIAVDDQGTINWDPQRSGLAPGTYRFELVDTQGWHGCKTMDDLDAWEKDGNNAHYGTMYVTVGEDGTDSCEYSLDLEKVAKKFGLKAEDINLVESNFGRLGKQWISTAGASSGPLLGVGLSVGAVGAIWFARKKRFGILN